MKDIPEQDLIGYLLGALESHQEQQIVEALHRDDSLRIRLSDLEEQLADMPERFVEMDPPPGLVDKTLNTIEIVESSLRNSVTLPDDLKPRPSSLDQRENFQANDFQANDFQATDTQAGKNEANHGQANHGQVNAKMRPAAADEFVPSSGWSMMDMIVAAAVCFVLAAVLLPSIANSRYQSNVVACQNNLREIGLNLASLAESQQGEFYLPHEGSHFQASQYVHRLLEAELASGTEQFICPNDPGRDETARYWKMAWNDAFASPATERSPSLSKHGFAHAVPSGQFSLVTPEEDVVDVGAGDEQRIASYESLAKKRTRSIGEQQHPENGLVSAQVNSAHVNPGRSLSASLRQSEAACGSYGFAMPTLSGRQVNSIQIPARSNQVLCADAACFDNPGFQSRNHGGKGQNVLLGDLSVNFIRNTACLPSGDHIYTNKLGQVQPGIVPDDNLIFRGVIRIDSDNPRSLMK